MNSFSPGDIEGLGGSGGGYTGGIGGTNTGAGSGGTSYSSGLEPVEVSELDYHNGNGEITIKTATRRPAMEIPELWSITLPGKYLQLHH